MSKSSAPEWTQQEIDVLRELYPKILTRRLAEQIGRPYLATKRKATQLALKKTEDYMLKHAPRFRLGQKLPLESLSNPPLPVGTEVFRHGCVTSRFAKCRRRSPRSATMAGRKGAAPPPARFERQPGAAAKAAGEHRQSWIDREGDRHGWCDVTECWRGAVPDIPIARHEFLAGPRRERSESAARYRAENQPRANLPLLRNPLAVRTRVLAA